MKRLEWALFLSNNIYPLQSKRKTSRLLRLEILTAFPINGHHTAIHGRW